MRVQDDINVHNQEKRAVNVSRMEVVHVADLVETTSNTSFTWPATFGRRHHSPPYSILCASPRGLHPNVIFSQDSQVGVPKLGLLLSQNFGRSYISSNQVYFESARAISYSSWKYLSNDVYHAPIGLHLTPDFKGFIIKSQVFYLTHAPSFDCNSCKSCLNE